MTHFNKRKKKQNMQKKPSNIENHPLDENAYEDLVSQVPQNCVENFEVQATPSALSLEIGADNLASQNSEHPQPAPTQASANGAAATIQEDRGEEGSSAGEVELERVELDVQAMPLPYRACPQDFQLLSVLGKGGFGKVFQVRKITEPGLNNIYAMKVLKKASLTSLKDREHTKTERNVLQMVKHPFLVELVFAFQTPGKLYLILEYLAGGELFTHLARSRFELSEDHAAFYISEIVLALAHLHSLGILYRDLKPENVLLDREGHVKMTDFGLSKQALGDDVRTYTHCGTLEYMAPEVIESEGGHGKEADWWSLGILSYDILHGTSPFYCGNRTRIKEKILRAKVRFDPKRYLTDECKRFITNLLKRKPEERLGSGHNGSENIKKHAFFRHTNWTLIEAREVAPPFVPNLLSPEDRSCFDDHFTKMTLSDSPDPSSNTPGPEHPSPLLGDLESPSAPCTNGHAALKGRLNQVDEKNEDDLDSDRSHSRSSSSDHFFRGFSYVAPSVLENLSSSPWLASPSVRSRSRQQSASGSGPMLEHPEADSSTPDQLASTPGSTNDLDPLELEAPPGLVQEGPTPAPPFIEVIDEKTSDIGGVTQGLLKFPDQKWVQANGLASNSGRSSPIPIPNATLCGKNSPSVGPLKTTLLRAVPQQNGHNHLGENAQTINGMPKPGGAANHITERSEAKGPRPACASPMTSNKQKKGKGFEIEQFELPFELDPPPLDQSDPFMPTVNLPEHGKPGMHSPGKPFRSKPRKKF